MPIKTFRGLIADDSQEKIHLATINGRTGYRIVKFELMSPNGAVVTQGNTVQVWSVEQAAVTSTIDFSDQTLLAAGIYHSGSGTAAPRAAIVISFFDNVIFNQDIYITNKDIHNTVSMNYYLELEQMRINSDEATMATLKNMRTTATQTAG
jgi:hypothetical protein